MESQEFKKILQLALFVIDDKTETKSKADIHLHVDQVTKVLKVLKWLQECKKASIGEISWRWKNSMAWKLALFRWLKEWDDYEQTANRSQYNRRN